MLPTLPARKFGAAERQRPPAHAASDCGPRGIVAATRCATHILDIWTHASRRSPLRSAWKAAGCSGGSPSVKILRAAEQQLRPGRVGQDAQDHLARRAEHLTWHEHHALQKAPI